MGTLFNRPQCSLGGDTCTPVRTLLNIILALAPTRSFSRIIKRHTYPSSNVCGPLGYLGYIGYIGYIDLTDKF